MALTPNYAWPLPDMDDPANVPSDMKLLGDAIDATVKGKEIDRVPIGALLLWAAAAAPTTNWLLCQGQTVSEVDYPDLGTILGAAGGLITLPDLRNRFPVGVGSDYALSAAGGLKTVALATGEMPAHSHSDGTLGVASHTHGPGTLTVAAHAHSIQSANVVAAGNEVAASIGGGIQQFSNANGGSTGVLDWPVLSGGGFWDGVPGSHTHTMGTQAPAVNSGATSATQPAITGSTGSVGGGAAHENRPPYLALNFIIRGR